MSTSETLKNPNEAARSAAAHARADVIGSTSILEAISDGVVFLDQGRLILTVNRPIEQMFGYAKEEIVGRSLGLLFSSDASKQNHHYRNFVPSTWDGTSEGEFKLIGVRRDGTSFPIEVRILTLLSSGGPRSAAIIRNLTRELDLLAAKEASEAANESKSRFLTNMSHELRTPLNAIIGFAEILINELYGPLGHPKYIEYANDMKDSGVHLLHLINHILDLSRIEIGRYELRMERVLPIDLVKDAVRFVRLKAQEGGIALDYRINENLPLVDCDRRAIRQVLLNLLSNSLKFTAPGGTVKIDAHAEGAALVILVSDTGVGIPSEHLARICKPFEQVANPLTREHEGVGLGLSISKALVDMHKGTLSVASEEGAGTVVTVRLPLQHSHD